MQVSWEGNEVLVTTQWSKEKAKKFTLEIIKAKKRYIGVNTHRANKIVKHGLENKLISELKQLKILNQNLNSVMIQDLTFYVIIFNK